MANLNRRYLILLMRLTILAVVAMAWGVSWWVAIMPLALAMPPLFGVTGCPAICSTYPTTISVTYTGVANYVGPCSNCTNINATYVISASGPVSCCAAVSASFGPTCTGADQNGTSTVNVCFLNSGGNLQVRADTSDTTSQSGCFCCALNGIGATFTLTTATAVPTDCSASATYNPTLTINSTCCNYSGATCTVVI